MQIHYYPNPGIYALSGAAMRRWVVGIILFLLASLYVSEVLNLAMSALNFLRTMMEGYQEYQQSVSQP